MVEVADGGGLQAAGGDAGFVAGSDERGFACRGSAFGDAVVAQVAVVVDDAVPPLRVGLFQGNLTGDVGEDGSVAGDDGGVVVEVGQSGQSDLNVDHAPPVSGLDASADAQTRIITGHQHRRRHGRRRGQVAGGGGRRLFRSAESQGGQADGFPVIRTPPAVTASRDTVSQVTVSHNRVSQVTVPARSLPARSRSARSAPARSVSTTLVSTRPALTRSTSDCSRSAR